MELVAPGIHQLDTRLGGWDHLTAGFLVEGPAPALIETGSQSSVNTVREALHAIGVGADDLRWIIVTHIHLDHAGGVGDLAAAFPKALVVVHRNGARHIIDPSRLIESAGRVYGSLLDSLYGRMLPVPEDRVVAADDGYRVDVGNGRTLVLIDSPGHAKHHHAVLDEQTGTLLVGDAVGVQLPEMGVLRPAAPPPEFDLELAVASLHRFTELRPKNVVLTHYGAVPHPDTIFLEAEAALHEWVDVAKTAMTGEGATVEAVTQALTMKFATLPEFVPSTMQERLEVLNGIHSNAMGIHRYLSLSSQTGTHHRGASA